MHGGVPDIFLYQSKWANVWDSVVVLCFTIDSLSSLIDLYFQKFNSRTVKCYTVQTSIQCCYFLLLLIPKILSVFIIKSSGISNFVFDSIFLKDLPFPKFCFLYICMINDEKYLKIILPFNLISELCIDEMF
jgi:hypothetical protein